MLEASKVSVSLVSPDFDSGRDNVTMSEVWKWITRGTRAWMREESRGAFLIFNTDIDGPDWLIGFQVQA